MDNVTFAVGRADDLAAVKALLERCGLTTEDLAAGQLGQFVLCRSGDALVGTVGLELYGDTALLRSLAVAAEVRGHGLGHQLWRQAQGVAQRLGIRRLYLLTTTAEPLFTRWGFQVVQREGVPPDIRGATQFASVCPSTATVMTLELAGASLTNQL